MPTPNLGLTIPVHNAPGTTWEPEIDADLNLIDAAVGANTTAIAAEAVRAEAAETGLATSVATETTRAEGVESTLATKASLATVATSGKYTDLTSLPTLGTAAAHAATDFDANGAASSVQSTLTTALTAEITRAEAAESTLTTAVAGKQATLGFTPENVANKAVANGYPSLDSTVHIPINQLPAAVQGAMSYIGVWNAATNSPAIASGAGIKGNFYKVSVAGSTTIDGNATWHVGDLLIFDGTTWDKVDNYEAVTSVVGRTGAITLAESDITGLTTNLGTLTTGLAAEISRAESAESTLTTNLAAEVTRAVGVEATLAPIDNPSFNRPVGIDVSTPDQALSLDGGDSISWMVTTGGGVSASDTGISRSDVATVAIGNGNPGDASGRLECDTVSANTYEGIPTIPSESTTTPLVNGTATIGATGTFADGAHVHPTDISRAPLANPNFNASSGTGLTVSGGVNLSTALFCNPDSTKFTQVVIQSMKSTDGLVGTSPLIVKDPSGNITTAFRGDGVCYSNAFSTTDNTSAAISIGYGSAGLALNYNMGVQWAPSSGGAWWATKDTSLSRTAAGIVAVGNGTIGDYSGTLKAAKLNLALTTPASSSATGNAGDMVYSATYIYICTATNTWKRVALSTF